jgi:hypothetical protein
MRIAKRRAIMGIENLSGFQWSRFSALEKIPERDGLITLHGTGYTDCFRMHHIETQIIELDEYGEPKENLIPKKDKEGKLIKDRKGNPIMEQIDIVILEGRTIPDKVNYKKFMEWLKEDDPIWFNDFVDGKIIPNGTKNYYIDKLREWEIIHRDGSGKGRARRITHPKQKKVFDKYLDFAITYWIMNNKHKKMSREGWGFADPWVFQEMSRILSFNKTAIPKMYETVHKCLDTNMNAIIQDKVAIAVVEACQLIGMPLREESTEQLIEKVFQSLQMDDSSINNLAQYIVDDLSKQMHQLFLKEKRNISPEPLIGYEEQPFLDREAS